MRYTYRVFRPLFFFLLSLGPACLGNFHLAERFVNAQGHILDCLGDSHQPCIDASITSKQQAAVMDYAAQKKAFLIVEDRTGYGGTNEVIKRYIAMAYTPINPLRFMTTACIQKSIACKNIEFRYAGSAFKTPLSVTAAQVMQDIDAVIAEVKGYNDTPLLNQYYAHVIRDLETHYGALMQRLRTYKGTAYAFAQTLNEQERKEVESIVHFELINARILHAVYEQRHYTHIIICVGSQHIETIEHLFKLLGYQKTAHLDKPVQLAQQQPPLLSVDCAVDVQQFLHTAASAYTQSVASDEADESMLAFNKKVALVVGTAAAAAVAYKAIQWYRDTKKAEKASAAV